MKHKIKRGGGDAQKLIWRDVSGVGGKFELRRAGLVKYVDLY